MPSTQLADGIFLYIITHPVKKKVKLCPGEMEYVTLKQSVIKELPVNAEITVRVEA